MNESVVRRERQIQAAPEQVWALLAAFDQISRWAANVDHSAYTTAATEGVGSARRVQAGQLALIETVTEWDPPTALAYTLDGLPPLVRTVTNRWALEGKNGGTAVSLTTTIEPAPGPRGKIGTRVFGRVLGKASDTMLDGLSTQITAAPVQAAHVKDSP